MQPLDQDVVNLTKAIRQQESGGDFNRKGASGEFGAYQFMPDTWKANAGEVLGDSNAEMTPQNQNKVAYTKIKAWKDAGNNVGQIASMWNAGPNKPNAYAENWKGVNDKGVAYDTPAYAKAVATYYHQFKGETPGTTQESPVEQTPEASKTFRYDIPTTPEDSATKLRKYQAEATTAQEESDKQNSFLGQLKNFGKAFVENIAGSETGLGKTIADSQFDFNGYAEHISTLSKSNATLHKLITEKEAKGIDTTSLKKTYNSNTDLIDEWKGEIQKNLEDLPKTSKVVGQLAGTLLDTLTAGTYGKVATAGMKAGEMATKEGLAKAIATGAGFPELGKIAEMGKPTGIFTVPGVQKVLKGAGIGYLYDVTQGMQGARGENREGIAAGIPGIGTLLGASISAIPEIAQSAKNKFSLEGKNQILINSRERELSKLDSYQTLKKAVLKGEERGIDVKKVLSTTDVLHGSVDNTGTIHTLGEGGAVEQYTKQFIDGNESIVSDLLKKEGRSVSAASVKKALIDNIKSAGIEGKALTNGLKSVDDEVAGYMMRSTTPGTIPVETLHNAKVDKYNSINFFTEGNTKKLDKTIARTLRELVEKNTTSVQVANINKELSKHFAVIDYLTKLDNKKVEGGKLGKYFASTVGAIVGHGVAGPLGGIAGAEAGARVKGGLMERTFKGKTGIVQPQSEVITNAKKVLEEKPLELQSSKSLGNLQNNQTTTIINTNKGISPIISKNKGKIKVGTAIAGAGVGTAAVLAANSKNTTTYQAPPDKGLTSEDIVRKLMGLESSGGTNRTNAGKNEQMWLTGLTPVAIRELKNKGRLDKNFDKNNKEDVLKASVAYFNLMKEQHPGLSDAEIYVRYYWRGAKNNKKREEKMKEFNNL